MGHDIPPFLLSSIDVQENFQGIFPQDASRLNCLHTLCMQPHFRQLWVKIRRWWAAIMSNPVPVESGCAVIPPGVVGGSPVPLPQICE